MIFTLEDIRAHFPAEQADTGWQLFTAGWVSAPNVQRGGELVTAVLRRTGSRPLRVYVRTEWQGDKVVINAECSCIRRKDCEHAAAVLLQALEDRRELPADTDTTAAAREREASSSSQGRPKTQTTEPQQELLYRLHLQDTNVLVEPLVARRLRQGGHTVVCYYEPGRANDRTPARFLQPVDLEWLKALDRLPHAPATPIPRLDGAQAAALLEGVIATGRCYFEEVNRGSRLVPGPARQLCFHWRVDEFGRQRTQWRITPTADVLLPLSAPWYVDSSNGECGPLASDLPAGLVRELAELPAVAPEQVDEVRKRLQRKWPDSAIPPLRHWQIDTVPPLRPTPCLRVTTVEGGEPGAAIEACDIASLSFDYGGVEILRNRPSTRLLEGRIIRVQRDTALEKAALQRLHQLGFEENAHWSRHRGEDGFTFAAYVTGAATGHWLDFQVEAVPALRAEGWRIVFDHFRHRLAEVSQWFCDVSRQERDWFSIGLGVEVDGQLIDLLPILLEVLGELPRGLPDRDVFGSKDFIVPFTGQQSEERLLRLPAARLLPLLETLLEIYDGTAAVEGGGLRLSRVQLARLTALEQLADGPRLQWLADDDILQLVERLRALDGIPQAPPPAGLAAQLRPYQQQGLDWLQLLREYGLAGVLADDMGLGKTVQALAHLLLERESGRADRPSLVLAPTSLMFNWRHEAERFAPGLKVLVLHGPKRGENFPLIAGHDLVITTYPLLVRDRDALLAHRYHLLVLDEAQVIKNPKAQAGRVVREIDARHRLCLTGTPLENHLGELWSLFDFLLPGLLGTSKQFRRFFRTPIEKHGNETVLERLGHRVRPFLLRRSKQQVAAELPAKTEIIRSVVLEGAQRELYETVRPAMHQRVREEIERQGLARSHILVLDALLKLRQVCCHPALVKMEKTQAVRQSAKLAMLMEMLPEMIEEGRRILLFSQFT
ncbi:MAG: SNF2-related protein, partial [Parahaliea sp.]